MYCCITGAVPTEPVISRLNGSLYDRHVIEAYIAQHNKDPVTGEPLSATDLIPVHGGAPTGLRTLASASIPGLLSQLHAEWDSVMLEQFSLRQQLAAAQQELSHALYKHDAACRVIARLITERDQARRAAGLAVEADAGGRSDDAAEPSGTSAAIATENRLPPEVVAEINTQQERLRATRKRRQIHPDTPKPTDFDFYAETADITPSHVSPSGTPTGVSCMATMEAAGMQAVFTGGRDGKVICLNLKGNQQVSALIGHTGPVNDIETALDFAVTCGDDGSTRVWRSEVGNYRSTMTLKGHQGAVLGLCILPSNYHVLTAGVDGLLNLQDMERGIALAHGLTPDSTISSVALHPDGVIVGTGGSAAVHLWDVRTLAVDVSIPLPAKLGSISSISFSSNGWSMALGSTTGTVQVYDLRRGIESAIDTLQFDEPSSRNAIDHQVSEVSYDPSGQYLAVAAQNLTIFHATDVACQRVHEFAHPQRVTCVAWGSEGTWLTSGSIDRHVKVWARRR